MSPKELAKIADRILQTKKFRDYPGARNGLQVSHGRSVKKIGWAADADLESIRRAGREKVDFLVVHHGIFWGNSPLDRAIRARRIREAKRAGVAIYSSHLPLDAHPEIGNSIGLIRALGLDRAKRRPFGKAMGREIGWKLAGGKIRIANLGLRIWKLGSRKAESGKGNSKRGFRISDFGFGIGKFGSCEGVKGRGIRNSKFGIRICNDERRKGVKVVAAGPEVCRRIGIVTGGFGDLDQVRKAGLDTLVTGEVDYPTEVKARELGINLILAGHFETETFGVQALAGRLRAEVGGQ